ncbi:MAG: helix-turn-helix domain-containing protein [Deltaproteobacteria bacterium]|jgi:hypothetical protein|nr:helix-turn-helix domain-containing protein [Deltaproteobacteria bacterium]
MINQQLKDLILHVQGFSPHVVALSSRSSLFTAVGRIEADTAFQRSVLYIGRLSQIQNTLRFIKGMTLLLAQDIDNFTPQNTYDNSIILFPPQFTEESLFDACREFVESERDVLGQSSLLLDAFLERKSLAQMLDLAAETVVNPIIVLDSNYRILASSQSIVPNDQIWREKIAKGYISHEHISAFIAMNNDVRQAAQSETPFIAGCTASPLQLCVVNMHSGEHTVGYLLCLEDASALTKHSLSFLHRFSLMVSRMLDMLYQKNAYTDAEQGNVLTDYFYGRVPDKRSFDNRLAQTIVRNSREYLVAIYDTEHYNVHDYYSEELKTHILQSFSRSIPVIYDNDLVVLIDTGEDKNILQIYQGRAQGFLHEHHIRVGFSDTFTEAYTLDEHRRQAKKALLFSRLQSNRLYAVYDEYKAYDLLMRAKTGNGLEGFTSNECKPIIEYDAANNTEYLKTAFFYIYYMKNLKQVADALFVHKNTVSYRINKIKELFNIDLEKAKTRAGILHSYMLRQLLEKPEIMEKYERI